MRRLVGRAFRGVGLACAHRRRLRFGIRRFRFSAGRFGQGAVAWYRRRFSTTSIRTPRLPLLPLSCSSSFVLSSPYSSLPASCDAESASLRSRHTVPAPCRILSLPTTWAATDTMTIPTPSSLNSPNSSASLVSWWCHILRESRHSGPSPSVTPNPQLSNPNPSLAGWTISISHVGSATFLTIHDLLNALVAYLRSSLHSSLCVSGY